jgi:hypothetical protein
VKNIVLLACLSGCPLFGFAQGHTVQGQVYDSLNNPIPLVHVLILKTDAFVTGAVTDFDGNFATDELEPGTYLLKIEAIGYADFVQEFTHEGDFTDFETIQLKAMSITLDGVELVGRKKLYERRANSLIINVEQHIAGSGGSVLDLLGNTAGVSINQQNGTLSLRGKGQVSIMLDGKLSRIDGQALMGLLKSMPASDIKNLEVFNNPPSKYEANGSGGMINIVTRSKNKNGQGGSISLISGYGKGEKTGASSNFHYQYGKMGLFGNYAFLRNRSPEEWGLESEFNTPPSQKMVRTNSLRKPVTVSHNYMLGMEYAILENTYVGGTLSGYSSKWNMLAFDKVIRNSDPNGIETLDIETNEINHWNHISGNFHVERSFGEEHHLIFDYDHLYYHDDNPSNYQIPSQGQTNLVEIQKETPITFNVYNLDYQGVLSKSIRLEVGVKTNSSSFHNDIAVSSTVGNEVSRDEDLSSSTQMNESIWAMYSSFQFQLNEKTNLTTGLRYEHTDNTLKADEEGNPTHRRYGNLFPNLVLTYGINEVHRFQINYSRRINRPTFNHLAPYVLFLGPDALYSGNANLQPAFVNTYGMEWGWLGKQITLEYLTEKDAIIEFQPRLSTSGEQYVFKAENMDQRNMLSISLGIPVHITQWWQADNSFIFQYETLETQFQGTEFKRTKESFRATVSQQFSLGVGTTLELSGYYQSETLFGISTFGARGAFNLGFRQELKKNYGTLKLSFTNVFSSDNWRIKTSTAEPFVNTLETYFPESRIVALTYTKNFGGNKKERKYKGNSADEEKKRVQ